MEKGGRNREARERENTRLEKEGDKYLESEARKEGQTETGKRGGEVPFRMKQGKRGRQRLKRGEKYLLE